MKIPVVVDSNIFIGTIIRDESTPKARALLKMWIENDFQLSAPALFRYEIMAVMRKHIYRGSLLTQQANEAIQFVFEHDIRFYLDQTLLQRGLELANQFNLPTAYDSQYLAVAEYLGCEFWTGDKGLIKLVTPKLTWVKYLGDFVI
jgi:predicted nucleic acid-binding protein